MALQKLGPYLLESVLGRGGMGTVYRAVDADGHVVAVKALAPTLCLDEHFRQRFESEIETMMKMDHPNIVRLLGYGQDDGVMFFAMELVDGHSLFALQKEKVLFDWRAVLRITLDVCAGLQHAHNRGIIHRDLKPGNLIREASGNVKITDFGIAKSFGGSNLTGEGSVLGTMDFMSPEQAKTGRVTVRSDLYSLGAVMYTLLARRPPLHADTLEESLQNLKSGEAPDIRSLVPGIPRPFAETIHRLLDKDPNKRFATALALSKHLVDLQSELRETSEAKTESGASEYASEHTQHADPLRTQVSSGVSPAVSEDTTSFEIAAAAALAAGPQPAAAPAAAGPRPGNGRSAGPATADDTGTQAAEAADPTRAAPAKSLPGIPPIPQDFYSPVTPEVRARYHGSSETETTRGRNAWLLAIALIAVLGLSGFGIYENMIRKRSAASLLQAIEARQAEPIAALDEINTFLQLYPDHERAEEVVQLKQLAAAIQLRRRLIVLKGLKGHNPLEQRFLDFTDFDSFADVVELESLLATYQSESNLDAKTQEVVAAAQAYLAKFARDCERQSSTQRALLQKELGVAATAETAGDTAKAEAIYQTIAKYYADRPWAQDLVQTARSHLPH